jgi:type I restriction enzyme M protein
LRDRSGEILFIDARKIGYMVDRVLRVFTDEDISKITTTFHKWRSGPHPGPLPVGEGGRRSGEGDVYMDIPGFCKAATLAEIAGHGYVLTPGRYVGAEDVVGDGEPFEEKMARLVAELQGQFAESAKLEQAIRKNLGGLGYEL